jgi:hypothetical protein
MRGLSGAATPRSPALRSGAEERLSNSDVCVQWAACLCVFSTCLDCVVVYSLMCYVHGCMHLHLCIYRCFTFMDLKPGSSEGGRKGRERPG